MDRNAIKKYAVWARRELISRVSQKAMQYGIAEDGIIPASAASVNGVILSEDEIKQRKALIERISKEGYQQVMEEVAYTWFNRFAALRFMEVNGYLPSRVRIFTDKDNQFKPQIIDEAINLELDWMDMKKVYALKDSNDKNGLFKYFVIAQCNALNPILPGMFQRIADYTELLFPDNLLREGSVIQQMIAMIPEEDWTDQVQIIGWLYQYYNSEKKDQVFEALKKNIKITKENIPAATQLFTPDWIVRYMVENSLGRLWIEHLTAAGEGYYYCYDESGNTVASSVITSESTQQLKSKWKYYLEEAEQEPEVQAQLREIRKEYAAISPAEIKCIDPCAGSGHILAYMFDVLMQIYESYGYTTREAVRSIIEHNLYGLDIDDRAAQLAYFSVMMKARQYDRRFLTRKDEDGNPDVPQLHVYALSESNRINRASLKYFGWSLSDIERNLAYEQMTELLDALMDAKEYGSILNIKQYNWDLLYRYAGTVDYSGQLDFDAGNLEETHEQLWNLIEIAATMAQKYDVVVTNPPYMGSSGMGTDLANFVKKYYPDSKSDLFAVFIERCGQMTAKNGYQAMITQHAWMFLSSFEKLRAKLQTVDTVNMAHLGTRAFEEIGGEVVQTTSFVMRKSHTKDYKGTYCRLIAPNTQQGKEDMFLSGKKRYTAQQDNFSKIPGSPVAYWISSKAISAFDNGSVLGDIETVCGGLTTGDNNRFLRLWFEVALPSISFYTRSMKETENSIFTWYPMTKGGEYRKWYGNNEYVVNWRNNGKEIKHWVTHNPKDPNTKHWSRRLFNTECYFRDIVTWSGISSGAPSMRVARNSIFGSGAKAILPEEGAEFYLAYLNSVVALQYLKVLSPTLNYESGHIASLPIIKCRNQVLLSLVQKCIAISKADWDSFETSWDFKKNPLL